VISDLLRSRNRLNVPCRYTPCGQILTRNRALLSESRKSIGRVFVLVLPNLHGRLRAVRYLWPKQVIILGIVPSGTEVLISRFDGTRNVLQKNASPDDVPVLSGIPVVAPRVRRPKLRFKS